MPGDAARFENLVACHLLKWVHFEQDTQGRDLELRYFRDIDGREVDFVVVDGRRPVLLAECKWADAPLDRPRYGQVAAGLSGDLRAMPRAALCVGLPFCTRYGASPARAA